MPIIYNVGGMFSYVSHYLHVKVLFNNLLQATPLPITNTEDIIIIKLYNILGVYAHSIFDFSSIWSALSNITPPMMKLIPSHQESDKISPNSTHPASPERRKLTVVVAEVAVTVRIPCMAVVKFNHINMLHITKEVTQRPVLMCGDMKGVGREGDEISFAEIPADEAKHPASKQCMKYLQRSRLSILG